MAHQRVRVLRVRNCRRMAHGAGYRGGSSIDGRATGDFERLAGAGKTERRMAFRAEVILAIAEGLSHKVVAERVGTRPTTVNKWRGRFAQEGLSGLRDAARSGASRSTVSAVENRE